jgi:ADP-ribosylglycohydrolase
MMDSADRLEYSVPALSKNTNPDKEEVHVAIIDESKRYTGCLLGGAIGDALGWPVEFADMKEILETYGPAGITEPVPGAEGFSEITDDTQMTLFTAEGLLRAWAGARHHGGPPDFAGTVRDSYRCWLATQEEGTALPDKVGWLLGVEGLHRRRAPGTTCLSALREGVLDEQGIVINTSKGCGGVMRAAPAGLLAARIHSVDTTGTIRLAFEIGCATAALTHGHPSGYYPAGVLAAVIATVVTGGSIVEGIDHSLVFLSSRSGSLETTDAIQMALDLWRDPEVIPSPETIESLGGGWVGEEALAIGLYCALVAGDDFTRGVQLAVNHSGDSDSTGAITGNIMGAMLGEQAIPAAWLNRLELHEVICQVGEDLYDAFQGTAAWLLKYPAG